MRYHCLPVSRETNHETEIPLLEKRLLYRGLCFRLNEGRWDRNKIKIYNFTSGNSVPLKWGEIFKYAEQHLMENPLEGLVWYPEGSFKRNATINR